MHHGLRGGWTPLSSSPLLHRGAPDTVRILCRSFTLKSYGQLRVKDLPKVPTWLELDSYPFDKRRRLYQWAITPHKTEDDRHNLFVPIAAKWVASGTDDEDDPSSVF